MTSLASTRVRLGTLIALAVPQLVVGIWALVAPQHWFDTFPGIAPHLVAAEPPFNRHLATDVGAGFFATGVALGVAAAWGHRAAIQMALLTYVAFAVPHMLYHAARPAALLTGAEDVFNVALLTTGPVVAGALAWWARPTSAEPLGQDAVAPPGLRFRRG